MVATVDTTTEGRAWGEALSAARRVSHSKDRVGFLLCIWRATKDPELLKEIRLAATSLDAFAGIELRVQIALETKDPQDFEAAQEAAQESDQHRMLTAKGFAEGGNIEWARILAGEITSPYWLTNTLGAIAKATRKPEDFAAVLTAVKRITGFNDNFGLSLQDMELGDLVGIWVRLDELDPAQKAAEMIFDSLPRANAFISIAQALAKT